MAVHSVPPDLQRVSHHLGQAIGHFRTQTLLVDGTGALPGIFRGLRGRANHDAAVGCMSDVLYLRMIANIPNR